MSSQIVSTLICLFSLSTDFPLSYLTNAFFAVQSDHFIVSSSSGK